MTMSSFAFPLARRLAAGLGLLLAPTIAAAQANLSGQGYGFPTGQFSARAHGSGGSLAEADPLSPINPAVISIFPSRILFFQMEPEYRAVKSLNGTEHTSTARYPIVLGALPIGGRVVLGISSSTLIDRTSTTSFRSTQVLNPLDSVPMTTTYRIDGGINDVRFAGAWAVRPWLRLGAGVHAITGRNLINLTQEFDDTLRFAPFTQSTTISFSGSALSGGVQLVSKVASLAASGRWGGKIHASNGDTVLARANVPNHIGISLSYLGIANSAISLRTSHESWSRLNGLATPGVDGHDSWDSSIGADLAGPRIANRIVYIRAGARNRTLPFLAAGEKVKENSFSGGLGTTFANGRVIADAALIRAFRSADVGASERSWTISFGISVRP